MLLDTCFCIDIMKEKQKKFEGPATKKLLEIGNQPIFTSLFVLCELYAGAKLSLKPQSETQKIKRFVELTNLVLPTEDFPFVYGETEAYLRKIGKPTSTMDLLIGVSALIFKLPLLTKNKKDFKNIPSLKIHTY